MTATPDGISMAELMALREQAQAEQSGDFSPETVAGSIEQNDECKLTREEIVHKTNVAMSQLYKEVGDISAFKAMAMCALHNLFMAHNAAHEEYIRRGNTESALAWARDGGQIQGMLNLLCNIETGCNDVIQ